MVVLLTIRRHRLGSKERGIAYLMKMRQLDYDVNIEFGAATFVVGVCRSVNSQVISHLLLR